jgi:flagellar biosynthetic protein FliR
VTEVLGPLGQLGQNQAAGFVLVLARVSPLFVLAPIFSAKMVPARAKGIVAVALAVGLAPIALQGQTVPGDPWELAGLVLKEALVGMAFAFTLAALFASVAAAGALLDTFIGFTYGSLIDPITGTQAGQMLQLYSMVGIAVLIAIGGDEWIIQGLARTYEVVPLLEMPSLPALVAGALEAFTGIFRAALEIAAPVVIALVLTDVAFGMVSRTVPQMNVFAVGFPAKIAVGLLIAGMSLPFVAGWLSAELQTSVTAALRSLRVAG